MALRAKIYKIHLAGLSAPLEQAERWQSLLAAAGFTHESPQARLHLIFGQWEEMLIFGMGDLAEVAAKHICPFLGV